MASHGYRFGRLPWHKLCSDPQMYILPGSLPHAFQLKDLGGLYTPPPPSMRNPIGLRTDSAQTLLGLFG